MSKSRNALVVCSGGLDSATLAYWVVEEVHPDKICLLFFDYGQEQGVEERIAVAKCYEKLWTKFPSTCLEVINSFLIKEKQTDYVPSRNLVFASYALNYAEAYNYSDIYFGFIDTEDGEGTNSGYWDAGETFFKGS